MFSIDSVAAALSLLVMAGIVVFQVVARHIADERNRAHLRELEAMVSARSHREFEFYQRVAAERTRREADPPKRAPMTRAQREDLDDLRAHAGSDAARFPVLQQAGK